jgi:hypothetical protein
VRRGRSLAAAAILLVAQPALARDGVSSAPVSFPPWVGDHHHACGFHPHDPWHRQIWHYRDPRSGILLKVAQDGRHLSAINPDGEVLWRRNPHTGIEPYRVQPTCILTVGPKMKRLKAKAVIGWSLLRGKLVTIDPATSEHLVALTFDNSQFGLVDIRSGEFFFGGQN